MSISPMFGLLWATLELPWWALAGTNPNPNPYPYPNPNPNTTVEINNFTNKEILRGK